MWKDRLAAEPIPADPLRSRHHLGIDPRWPVTMEPWWNSVQKGDKTYDLKARVENHDRISARIYKGIPLFGRTELLNRIRSHSLAGWCAG